MGPVLKDTQATEIRSDCVRCTQVLSVRDAQVFLERAERTPLHPSDKDFGALTAQHPKPSVAEQCTCLAQSRKQEALNSGPLAGKKHLLSD